jgi:c-di-GMP phosphodiesterase
VFGYELLFRDGVEDYFYHSDAEAAARNTLDTSVLMGLDTLCDGRQAFINCTGETLFKGYITLLPASYAVVEILKHGGYAIAACWLSRLKLAKNSAPAGRLAFSIFRAISSAGPSFYTLARFPRTK